MTPIAFALPSLRAKDSFILQTSLRTSPQKMDFALGAQKTLSQKSENGLLNYFIYNTPGLAK